MRAISPLGPRYLSEPNAYVRRGELGAIIANLVREQRRELNRRTLVGIVATAFAFIDVRVIKPFTERVRPRRFLTYPSAAAVGVVIACTIELGPWVALACAGAGTALGFAARAVVRRRARSAR